MSSPEENDTRNEQNDIRTLVIFRGKSVLIAQELVDSIDKLKKTYKWSDDKTIRIFGSRLRGNKLLEWLYTVKQLPEDEDKWNAVKSAFSRDFVKMSKIRRWRELTKIKQRKGQSLEVYRGTLEKLIGPTGICEEEKVAIFIMGLRKNYRSLLGSKTNYKMMNKVIQKLRENEDFGCESEEDQFSDVSDSEYESDSDSSSDSSDDDFERHRKKKKKVKKNKKKTIDKKHKSSKKTSSKDELIAKQLRTVQEKLEKLMTSTQNSVFSINEAIPTNNAFPVLEDLKTTNGLDVCGRCQRVGHKKESCARSRMRCNHCGILGHITPECRRKNNISTNYNKFPNNRGNNLMNSSNRPPILCFQCNQPGHVRQKCPQLMQKVASINQQVNPNTQQGILNE